MVLPSDKWSINTSLLEVFLSTSSAEYRIQVGHPGDYGTLHILYVCKLIQPMAAIRNKNRLSHLSHMWPESSSVNVVNLVKKSATIPEISNFS